MNETATNESHSAAIRYAVHLINQINSKKREYSPKTQKPPKRLKQTIMTTLHTGNLEEIYDVPLDDIIRPILPEVNVDKVEALMKTLSNPDSEPTPPIDLMWIKGSEGGNYYYSFGACHRYVAHKRLNLPTIRAKIVEATQHDLWYFLGASTPELK